MLSVEVQALQANVSEAQAKLNRLQERNAEAELQKQELESAIARGQDLIQRQTESTSLKVLRLKGEPKFIVTISNSHEDFKTSLNPWKISTYGEPPNLMQI